MSHFLAPDTPTPAHALQLRQQAATYGAAPAVESQKADEDRTASEAASTVPHPATQRGIVQRGRAGWREWLVVFVLSSLLAALFFHNAWDRPFGTQAGVFGDAEEYAWFLAWMPYAIGHGLNPLGSTLVNFPHGINLMWNTSVVLPSFLMSPFTLIFGAAFSYNLLATGAMALSSTFAYAAFRRWAGMLPALVGALIFGFSPYMVSQSVGHLAQTLMMTAPLFLIVLDRLLVVQAAKPWVDGLMLGALAWAQLLTGEEVLAMEAVVAVVAIIVICAMNDRAVLSYVAYAAKGLAVAAASFVVLSLPFLAYQYLGSDKVQDVHPPNAYVSDVLNFVVPTAATRFAPSAALHISNQFTGNASEDGAYIGIPLLLFILVTLVIARRRRVTWVALAITVGAALLSLGETLHVEGYVTAFELPDAWLQDLPFFHNLLPDRFTSIMFLGVGLLVAVGLTELKRFKLAVQVPSWALAAIGLVALLPTTNYPSATSPRYSAFESGFACPSPGLGTPSSPRPVALVLPSINEMALRWQVESRFCYVMPSDTGMTGTNQGDIGSLRLMVGLGTPGQRLPALTPAVRAQAAADLRALDVKEIIVAPEYPFAAPVVWTPNDQAQLIAWLEGLLGQVPVNSHDAYFTYVWKHLPPNNDIATGHVAYVRGAL